MARHKFFRRASRLFDVVFAIAVLGLVAIAAAWFEVQNSETLEGTFRVVDGDSLQLGDRKLRLVGIDAPEFNQTCQKQGVDYRCGASSTRHLKNLIDGRKLVCQSEGQDKYDRSLVECFVGDESINQSMVRDGWAVAFGSFHRQERLAQNAKIGLWAGSFDKPNAWRARYGGLLELELGSTIRRVLRHIRNLI